MIPKRSVKFFAAVCQQPIYYEKETDCEEMLASRKSGLVPGFISLARNAPELVHECPVGMGRTLPRLSTTARAVYEIGLDGSVSEAASAMGYFCICYEFGCKRGEKLMIEKRPMVGFMEFLEDIKAGAPFIGTSLVAINADCMDLWPKEKAQRRLAEDVSSLFLHIKMHLSPMGRIVVYPGGEGNWLLQRVDIRQVARDCGLVLTNAVDTGVISLQWLPGVPSVQSTTLFDTKSIVGFVTRESPESTAKSLSAILERTAQTGIQMSSRLAVAPEKKSLTFRRFLAGKKPDLSRSPTAIFTKQDTDSPEDQSLESMFHLLEGLEEE